MRTPLIIHIIRHSNQLEPNLIVHEISWLFRYGGLLYENRSWYCKRHKTQKTV